MFKTTAFQLFRSLAWLLTFAGLIMPAWLVWDAITATSTRAKVVEVEVLCEKRICTIGRCYWQKENCPSLQKNSSESGLVRQRPRVRLEFKTDDGMAEAWTHNMKLNLARAKVGDEIGILYRGPAPYYVSGPLSHLRAALGLLVSILGGLLLVLSGRMREDASA